MLKRRWNARCTAVQEI